MSDLLLVNPLSLREDPVEQRLMTPYFPLGLLYLAAVARRAGYAVSVFDGMFAAGDRDFVATLDREQPRLVGISVLATVRAAALRLAELAHRHGAIVVVGGSDPTGRPATYLQHRQNDGSYPIDVATVGEGEQTLLELLPVLLSSPQRCAGSLNRERLAQVRGLAFRDERDDVVATPPRALATDLDALPLPARDLVDFERYRQAWRERHGYFSMSLIATRGCPYHCSWCQKSVFGNSFRPRSPQAVADEMRWIKEEIRPDQLRIVDDVMGIDRRWVRAWHDAVLSREAMIPFECLSRVDLMDEEMTKLLKESGCRRIAFGAESGSQRMLDAMHKGTKVEQIRAAADLCRRHGIETYFYIMLGYPGEEWEDIRETVDLVKETRPDQFSATIAYPLPGTAFHDEIKECLLAEPDWDYTAENRLVFRRNYSTRFYRWTQRWLVSEWRVARLRHDEDRVPVSRRLRHEAALWISRGAVQALRCAQTFARSGVANHREDHRP